MTAHVYSGSEFNPDLILASASPRRRELLQQIGVRFVVQVSDIDETPLPKEAPSDYVCRLALAKAYAVAQQRRIDKRLPVLGADTIVVCDGQLLGKPVDQADGYRMLRLLSGRTHEVLTAVCLSNGPRHSVRLSSSQVRFRYLTDAEIAAYWQSGEPDGKAGAYAVQGLGAVFIEHLSGSYSGVMGLPLYETAALLNKFDVPTSLDGGKS